MTNEDDRNSGITAQSVQPQGEIREKGRTEKNEVLFNVTHSMLQSSLY